MKKLRFIILLFCMCFLMGCEKKSKSTTGQVNEIEETIQGKEEKDTLNTEMYAKVLGKCNEGRKSYRYYAKDEKVNLFFSKEVSNLNIQQLALYQDDVKCDCNVILETQKDNVLEISMDKYVERFNYVELLDTMGVSMKVYVGECYIEQMPEDNKEEDTPEIISSEYNDAKNVEITLKVQTKDLKNYDVECVIPQDATKYFKKTESQKVKGKQTKISIQYQLKENTDSNLSFNALIMVKNKKTGKQTIWSSMYIPLV